MTSTNRHRASSCSEDLRCRSRISDNSTSSTRTATSTSPCAEGSTMETAPRLGENLAALDLNYDGIVDLLGTDDILINKVDRHSTATACWTWPVSCPGLIMSRTSFRSSSQLRTERSPPVPLPASGPCDKRGADDAARRARWPTLGRRPAGPRDSARRRN